MAKTWFRIMKVSRIVGILKDKAAECRIIVRSLSPISVTIVRATSHRESPTPEKHVDAIHSACSTSPLLLSGCVEELKRRLRRTSKWVVALKCLILIHRLHREGDFILQDHLSVDTFTRGRSYLNLDGFRDTSTALTWQLSTWVRCYAGYIDQWLYTCRAMGEFWDGRFGDRSTTALANAELLRELAALGELLSVTCECLQGAPGAGKIPVVWEALRLVLMDTWQLRQEVLVRLQDLRERILGLRQEEAAEFLSTVERVGAQEQAFRTVMKESTQPGSLAAWEFAHVTDRLGDCLVSAKESLKAVLGFKSLIVRKPSERSNEKKVVYDLLSDSEALPISKLKLPDKSFANSKEYGVLPLLLI